ncbi:MAG TPA: hypothetical protein P5084_00560 [Paludibacter sp.]|nr:hypothetical protein [Paludibacter sp.]
MYLAHKTYSTQAKNALDESFENYLDRIDRTLIENDKIDEFLEDVIQQYKELAKTKSRCKPRELSFYRHLQEKGKISLHGSHVSFEFLKSKN